MLCTETITFGKYKNGSLNEILKDRSYCSWLLKQDWFLSNYEYLYNRVKDYNPVDNFVKLEEKEYVSFLESYKYFRLIGLEDLKVELTEDEKKCYSFYVKTIEDLKNKIINNSNTDNKYNIKAPVKWLKSFEKETSLDRKVFKSFIDSYDLPNITYIVEDIKKEGGIEYKGAQSFLIAKKLSLEQESFWEKLLKKKYGELIGSQFQYENCIFDFINISTNTIYECKLGIKDWNEKQHSKYKVTLNKYKIIYLISYDCIINMEKSSIYTMNKEKYEANIKYSNFDKIIENFKIIGIEDLLESI